MDLDAVFEAVLLFLGLPPFELGEPIIGSIEGVFGGLQLFPELLQLLKTHAIIVHIVCVKQRLNMLQKSVEEVPLI